MEWPSHDGREEQRRMAFHLTREGVIAEITPENQEQENQRAITSRDEWEAIAGHWPLKRLLAIWNSLPGLAPVEKFTSRQIALERIWRAVEFPTQARRNATAKVGKAKLHFRDGSKAAQAYALLCRVEGVTMGELHALTAGSGIPCVVSFRLVCGNR